MSPHRVEEVAEDTYYKFILLSVSLLNCDAALFLLTAEHSLSFPLGLIILQILRAHFTVRMEVRSEEVRSSPIFT